MEELNRIKTGSRWMWSLGDYSSVAPLLEDKAVELAASLDVHRGQTVLDVGAGNGNFAVAAARRGAVVSACDISPRMLELGRARSAAEGLTIEWLDGDAEDLPFDDASFEIVGTVFAAQFAPRPELVASEMFRVCALGGTVAMANYSPEGFLSQVLELLGRNSTSSLELPSPFEWGVVSEVERRLQPYATKIDIKPGQLTMTFPSVEDGLEFWERTNGPMIALHTMLSADQYALLRAELASLMARLNTSVDGGLELTSTYLKVIARR